MVYKVEEWERLEQAGHALTETEEETGSGLYFSMWWERGLLLRVACVVSLSQWHLRGDHSFLTDFLCGAAGEGAGNTHQLSAVKHEGN